MSNQSSAQMDYEPHTNLSINIKSANECRNLSELRYEINTIDHFIVKLIRDRMDYALATLKFKLDGKPIPDNTRIVQQLSQRKKWAEKYEVDPKFIESFFKSTIDWYMTQQIAHYKIQHPDEATTQFKICSLPELKAIEFDLNWIDILHYSKLLRSGYQKAREIAEPVLVSYTQKTSIFSDNINLTDVHPFSLFERSRHLSLSHGFLFAQPSQQFFMLALGSAQQFDINQIVGMTPQEFHSKVKEVVEDDWKRLLLNGIIENCEGRNVSGHGPILTGGLCFDHQNHFGDASFVLPRVQFNHEKGNTYMTFNTVITNSDRLEQEMQLIDLEIISLLEFCHELLKKTERYTNDILNKPFDHNNHTELNPKLIQSSDIWKQTVHDAIKNITNSDLEKVMLVREAEIKTDSQTISNNVDGSLTRLCSLYPSSYVFGVLRQGSCFFGVTPSPIVRLHEKQLEVAALTSITMKKNNEIEEKMLETKLFNSSQHQREHGLMIDFIKKKLQSITETNSLVVSDKPATLKLANLQYLYTPVKGTIRREVTLLDLVQTLHPIHTINGFPQSNTLEFIRQKENLDRGWFAAPIGWIDSHNNGEFVVSLIAALMNQDSVSLFAGCDIVADSDPEDKLQETMLKMETMLFALSEK